MFKNLTFNKQFSNRTSIPKHNRNAIQTAIDETLVINSPSSSSLNNKEKLDMHTHSEKYVEIPDGAYDIQSARRHIASCIIKGSLSASVLTEIQITAGFLPMEGSLIDFKRDIPKTAYEIAKAIRHIVAFHNVYGGYLVFGVAELESDKTLIPIQENNFEEIDSKKYRDLCIQYTGTAIEIQTASIAIDHNNKKWHVQLLHIPPRTKEVPVAFNKRGPENLKNVAIFEKDDFVLRYGDNSVKAQKTEHWRLLISDRRNPFIDSTVRKGPIFNTLPDRHLIFNTFIGRDEYISKLYEWFSDDYSCVKVLAGAGGLGKTSIAYQFASEICSSHSIDFAAVYWLTAKAQQFRPITDKYEAIAVTHFSSARELFSEIARKFAALDSEIESVSDIQIPKLLRDLLKEHKMFFVCDDLDSLTIDDQKRVVEVLQQLGGLGSRFLLTTRKNTTASSATAIELKGLTLDEFPKLISHWIEQLSLFPLSAKEVSRLHEASLGSPLYTESIFRLIKSGFSIAEAIAKWKGALGEEVRNAALHREVSQLGNEAKKVLVTVAILNSCSLAELRNASGFSELTLIDATNELQSLFLISPPAIAGEPRFSIPSTTRTLVSSMGPELVPGFISYRDGLVSQKFKAKGSTDKQKYIAEAIDQANALLIGKRPEEALKTAEEANRQMGGKNPDLLFMTARALTYHNPPRNGEASKRFNSAFNEGQRKLLFFSLWFETEMAIGHFESAAEVAGRALEASAGEKGFWLKRRAEARLQVAAMHSKTEDVETAIAQLKQAADDLAACPDKKSDVAFRQEWESNIFNAHDALVRLMTRGPMDVPALLGLIDEIIHFPKRGDMRIEVFLKLEKLFTQIKNIVANASDGYSTQQFNLLITQGRRCLSMFREAPANFSNFPVFRAARERLVAFVD